MGLLARIFGSKPGLSEQEQALVRHIRRLVQDVEYQNGLVPPEFLEQLLAGASCDEVPGAQGPFGRVATNPIPVNGVIGELAYLSHLRSDGGERLFFHRLGSTHAIDVFEAVSWSGSEWYILYLDFYHPRPSKKSPQGFSLTTEMSQFSGFTWYCSDFPKDFVVQKHGKETPLRAAYISQSRAEGALRGGTFVRPVEYLAALKAVRSKLSAMQTSTGSIIF